MNALDRANSAVNAARVDPRYRGAYHLSPPSGWMNDPNGLASFGGAYHVFYQHNPFAPRWGKMHWGHATTTDFVSWRHEPVALAPERWYESLLGCFSGTAIAEDGRLTVMYTGVSPFGQLQCLASSADGLSFERRPSNPAIRAKDLPRHASVFRFRDPKITARDGAYYCLVGARDRRSGSGIILLFRSADLAGWEYAGDAWSCPDADMVECPDIVRMDDGRDLLICSPTNIRKEGHRNLHSVVYSVGALDTVSGTFRGSPYRQVDLGYDFYAAQAMKADDGRTVMIAWMQMWKRSMPTAELGHGWAGSMTLPRELTLDGDALIQAPVRELSAYRRGAVRREAVAFSGVLRVDGVEGDRLELAIEADVSQARAFGLRVLAGKGGATVIAWSAESGMVAMDRSGCGVPIRDLSAPARGTAGCGTRSARVDTRGGVLSMRVFIDRCSVEVFLQGGRATLTATVYPEDGDTGVEFFSEGAAVIRSLEKYDIVA
ncbi:MAG: glycoside hydrolase family 32 protein [Spirochaetes bacterium]|nr:glycoside hydrolase family 32 protein [Spirochaetota bacterium]MBU1082026.1 glycoside hydrolase family 32 protein [Spirochaetota bacterium]